MSAAAAPSADALQAKRGSLKKIEVKEGGVAPEQALLDNLKKIFTDNGGDFAKIAAASGCDAKLLAAKKPASADEFAAGMAAGFYSA